MGRSSKLMVKMLMFAQPREIRYVSMISVASLLLLDLDGPRTKSAFWTSIYSLCHWLSIFECFIKQECAGCLRYLEAEKRSCVWEFFTQIDVFFNQTKDEIGSRSVASTNVASFRVCVFLVLEEFYGVKRLALSSCVICITLGVLSPFFFPNHEGELHVIFF